MPHRISRAARRYLLHGKQPSMSFGYYNPWTRTYVGGCWALQNSPYGDAPTVHFFTSAAARLQFLRGNPRRYLVGKRNPLVKAFRTEAARLLEVAAGFRPGYMTVLYGSKPSKS